MNETSVGFIGLGTMGAPMAARLLEAGYQVKVHNRTRERELPLAAAGADRAATPEEAATDSRFVFTMVSDTPDLEEVVLGENGVIHGLGPGALLIDMSTISPAATRRIAERLQEVGASMLDAPVSGGSEGAVQGTLSIMAGGSAEDLERARPLLEELGKSITLVGPTGSGQLTKAINQVIIAGTYAAVAEGLALGLKAGIDMEAAHRAVSGGAAGSWGLSNRGPNMIRNDYPLGFRTRLHRKDLGIALAAARELGVPLPITAHVEQLETSLVGRGLGDEDVSNIARVVRQLAGID
ncbi:MAG TPA: NAD(P)-dependent oxidoreductase [Trueperaceae bacterium]